MMCKTVRIYVQVELLIGTEYIPSYNSNNPTYNFVSYCSSMPLDQAINKNTVLKCIRRQMSDTVFQMLKKFNHETLLNHKTPSVNKFTYKTDIF